MGGHENWYHKDFEVHHRDLDVHGRLRVTSLLDMVQEMAGLHARHLGVSHPQGPDGSLIWVLSRLSVELDGALPEWTEAVRLYTAPTGLDRLMALRELVAEGPEGRVFARIHTGWLLIHQEKRRLARPEPVVGDLGSEIKESLGLMPSGKVDAPLPTQECSVGRAGWNEVDGNGHVNNVAYLAWVLGTHDISWFSQHHLRSLRINFAAEVLAGDPVWVRQGPGPEGVHRYQVDRGNVAEPSALLELHWEETDLAPQDPRKE